MSACREIPPGLTLLPGSALHRRLCFLVALIALGFVGLAGRLFHLQVLCHSEGARKIDRHSTSYVPLWGWRGLLLTRDQVIVAQDVIEYSVALDPSRISSEEQRFRTLDFLTRGLDLADEERRKLNNRLQGMMDRAEETGEPLAQNLPIRRGVPEGIVKELREGVARILPENERNAAKFEAIHLRQYPRKSFLGSVIGWVKPGSGGWDVEGAAGLELMLDGSLRAMDGKRKFRCEGLQKDRWYESDVVDVAPIHGYNARLTIDSRFQGIAEEELERSIERYRAEAGTVVIVDCRNGDLLALANLPSLDPNHYRDYPAKEAQERRWIRAISSEYEPGSTIKTFFAAWALEKKLYQPDTFLWGGGVKCTFGSRTVRDVHDNGPITFAEAVIFSSNIGMTLVGKKLGRDGQIDTLDRFHFQQKTGVLLPGEAPGYRTKRENWTENYTLVSVAFGYEVRMTPIQLCMAFASVVNGGHLYAPRLVERLERGDEVHEFPVREVGRPIGEETSRKMRDILVQVVERGTAKGHRIPGFTYGGKTGTRISAGKNGDHYKDYLSSFIAFAPAEDPQIVVGVFIERPKDSHYGSTVCGPVVTGILKRGLRLPPDLAAETRAR